MKQRRGSIPRHVEAANTLMVPPHSVEAEQAVLGSLMLDNSTWDVVADCLTAEDFYRRDHQLIFAAIAELAGRREPLDAITVSEQLERSSQLEEGGGLMYLATLSRETPSAGNISAYTDIVRRHSRTRRIHVHATQLRSIRSPEEAQSVLEELDSVVRPEPAKTGSASVSMKDITPSLLSDYLVKGLMSRVSINALIAESGGGKSYLLMDLASHASLGVRWCGHRTHGGLWFYVCLEGYEQAKNRLAAIKVAKPHLAQAPLELSSFNLDLMSLASCSDLVQLVRKKEAEMGESLAALVIDTFNAATPGCDENDPASMSQALASVRYLRDELDATIVLVHHLGKDASRGARGHSSFKATLDSELTIELNDKQRVLKSTKQRDFETGREVMAFKLTPVTLGMDDDGDPITSCVVTPAEFVEIRKQPTGQRQRQLLAELERLTSAGDVGIWSEGELREIGRNLGMQKNTARDAVLGLRQLGYFVPTIGGSKLAFSPSAGPKGRNRTETDFSPRSDGTEGPRDSMSLGLSSLTLLSGGVDL